MAQKGLKLCVFKVMIMLYHTLFSMFSSIYGSHLCIVKTEIVIDDEMMHYTNQTWYKKSWLILLKFDF